MKKRLRALVVFVLFSASLFAQSGNDRMAAIGLGMSPFDETEALLTPYYINGRFFFSDFAARLGVGTSMLFSSDQEDDASSVKNTAQLDLRPGIEYHIGASQQAIPFIGIDFVYAMRNNNMNTSVGAPVSGAWSITDFEGNRGYSALGFNLVGGGDYFIGGGSFFVGTEIGLEFLSYTYSEIEWNDQVVIPSSKKNQFRLSLNSAIRLGVAF